METIERAITSSTFWTAVGAVAAVGALIAAVYYARQTSQILRLEQTPMLRMAPRFIGGLLDNRGVFIKNVGRGPAIGVALSDANGVILNFVDSSGTTVPFIEAIDPPSGGALAERLGRYEAMLERDLDRSPERQYCLYYQDVGGRFHGTREVVIGNHFRAVFLGRLSDDRVPQRIIQSAQVALSDWRRHWADARRSIRPRL